MKTNLSRRGFLGGLSAMAIGPGKISMGNGILSEVLKRGAPLNIGLLEHPFRALLKKIATMKDAEGQVFFDGLRKSMLQAGYPDIGNIDVSASGKGQILSETFKEQLGLQISEDSSVADIVNRISEKGYGVKAGINFEKILEDFGIHGKVSEKGNILESLVFSNGTLEVSVGKISIKSGEKIMDIPGSPDTFIKVLLRYPPEKLHEIAQLKGKSQIERLQEQFSKQFGEIQSDSIYNGWLKACTALTSPLNFGMTTSVERILEDGFFQLEPNNYSQDDIKPVLGYVIKDVGAEVNMLLAMKEICYPDTKIPKF